MTDLTELKTTHAGLQGAATRHRFIDGFGDGPVPVEKFCRYFVHKYVFVSGTLNAAPTTAMNRPAKVFERSLRHESKFRDMAYTGESW